MGASRLIDRVRGAQGRFRSGSGTRADSAEFIKVKNQLQDEILESLDFEKVGNTPRDELAAKLRETLSERVENRNLPLNRIERERLVEDILDNILGYGLDTSQIFEIRSKELAIASILKQGILLLLQNFMLSFFY